jgi:hypothetical protein
MSADRPCTGPATPHHRAVAHSAPVHGVHGVPAVSTAPAPGPGRAGLDSRPAAIRSTLVFRGIPRSRAPRSTAPAPAAHRGELEVLDSAATVRLAVADSAATVKLAVADYAATVKLAVLDPAATVVLDASDLEPADPGAIDPGATVQISAAEIAAILAGADLPAAPSVPATATATATGTALAAAATRGRRSLLATALLGGVLVTCFLLGAFFVLSMLVRSGAHSF